LLLLSYITTLATHLLHIIHIELGSMSESHTAARSALWERHTEAHSALSELANTPEASKALHKVETALEDFEKGGQAAKVKAKESKSSLRGRWPALSYDDRNNPKLTSLQHSLEYLDSHFKGASDAVTAYKDSVRHL
jgi:hypothetical protein